jgi:hypothetical protein
MTLLLVLLTTAAAASISGSSAVVSRDSIAGYTVTAPWAIGKSQTCSCCVVVTHQNFSHCNHVLFVSSHRRVLSTSTFFCEYHTVTGFLCVHILCFDCF